MNYSTSQAFKDARLVGIKALYEASGGPGSKPYVLLFDGVQPASGATAPGATLATVLLSTTATIVAHQLVITQADLGGDLITTQGSATWGRMFNAAGEWMLDGDVTAAGASSPGVFQVSGTPGTLLYLGARALLGNTVIA
jgi:hypothetical protein